MPRTVITSNNKKKILDIIFAWKGKLSWSLLCERVTRELRLNTTISRHTLLAYEDVKIAFDEKKALLKMHSFPDPREDLQLQDAYERIDKLEAKVRTLEAEKSLLIEQFVRWQYNLYLMGKNMDELNKELPESTNIEALSQMPMPSDIDSSKLNQPLSKLTRANDNKRKRTSG